MRVRDLGRELVSKELSRSGEFCLLSWHQETLELLLRIPWPTPCSLGSQLLSPPQKKTGEAGRTSLSPTQAFLGELPLQLPQPLQLVYSLQQTSVQRGLEFPA